MNGWLTALRAVESSLSDEKGEFALFAVFLPADSAEQWDLVLAAPWARRDDREILSLVASKVGETVNPTDRLRLARIVVVEPWHPDVQQINSSVEVEHGLVEFTNQEVFGYEAQRSIVITSKDYWNFIKRLFPKNAEFAFYTRDGNLYIRISWLLNEDPERPNKRSRNIILAISSQVLDDYLYVDNPRRHDAERQLAAFVADHLRTFNPHHRAPRYHTPPREEWRVTTALFSRETFAQG